MEMQPETIKKKKKQDRSTEELTLKETDLLPGYKS